ncbi:hypothetical protein F4604DRAFT_1675107 [Suillus subluteus]|nr:hypothetical protein F4604DRAFT_1675107 [Suillus subluteus]
MPLFLHSECMRPTLSFCLVAVDMGSWPGVSELDTLYVWPGLPQVYNRDQECERCGCLGSAQGDDMPRVEEASEFWTSKISGMKEAWELGTYRINAGDAMDGDLLDTMGDLPLSNEEWYEGAAKCYSQDGITFLDLFNANEHAEYRKENLFYPFTSREEWEVTDFLLRSALSMAAIDKFLQLSMIKRLRLLFNNAKDLRSWAEMLPKGLSWKCQITAAWLLHVYSEWLTGDTAWSIQDQLPQGATVLGTVLSSNKTNITMMTGARVTHPLLLGLANICMCTRTKLLSKVFMLTALLPIPQYLHPNQRMQAYIVNTPEACMLACVHGKTSPFTLASYLQFRDNFHHPTCACAITLEQLASIDVDPNDLEEFWLNGVFVPFWMGWQFSDPAIFLTPEALHHWHKQFYNHDMQWCLTVLRPITGYHHFLNGISKLKQVMGRVHRDIQHYIVGLIAGAAPCQFVMAIRALMDI